MKPKTLGVLRLCGLHTYLHTRENYVGNRCVGVLDLVDTPLFASPWRSPGVVQLEVAL